MFADRRGRVHGVRHLGQRDELIHAGRRRGRGAVRRRAAARARHRLQHHRAGAGSYGVHLCVCVCACVCVRVLTVARCSACRCWARGAACAATTGWARSTPTRCSPRAATTASPSCPTAGTCSPVSPSRHRHRSRTDALEADRCS